MQADRPPESDGRDHLECSDGTAGRDEAHLALRAADALRSGDDFATVRDAELEAPAMVDAAEKAQIVSRLERIQALMKDLDQMAASATDRQRVRDRMSRELEAAKEAVRLLGMNDLS